MTERLCVLIPSFNEARTIGKLVRQLRARDLPVYVIDDGSTDDTARIAAAEGAIVVKHERNMGKGASMREGFAHILKSGFDAIVVMDGDGQHTVEDIDNFLGKMKETNADMVIGNRMLNTSSMPALRIHTNRFMSALISKIAGQHLPDTQSGFRLIKSDVLKRITLESSNYEIESEMIIKAARQGFRIESAPIQTIYRDERSRINPIVDALRFIGLLAKTMARR